MTPYWTIKFEPLGPHFDIDLFYSDPKNLAREVIEAPHVTDILRINMKFQSALRVIPRGPTTCVSAVKCAMGIRAWWILTPKQLYFYLRRKGAKSIKGA